MKLIKKIILIVVLVLCVAGAFFLGSKIQEKKSVSILNIEELGFEEIGEMNTGEMCFTMVEQYEGEATKIFDIELGFTKPRLTCSVDGYVKAGVDFAKIRITQTPGKVLVVVPAPRITEVHIDMDSIKVLEETKGIFNSVRVKDTTQAQTNLETKAKEMAYDKGLIIRAQENAIKLVTNMVEKILPEGLELEVR